MPAPALDDIPPDFDFASLFPARPVQPIEEAFSPPDAEFDAVREEAEHPPLEDASFEVEHPAPPSLVTFDTADAVPKRRRRKKADIVAAYHPPLPLGAMPEDGMTRFDWRGRALSRQKHASGRYWFPEAFRTRVTPPMTKVTEIEPLFNELRRYSEHFVPLLQAEQNEAERQFEARLKEWPDDKLRREGYMLDKLVANTDFKPSYKVEGKVVTFSRSGSDATKPLPPHLFSAGQAVLWSRTDPLVDAVREPGAKDTEAKLRGAVLSATRGHVRVAFPSLPDDFDRGTWRIDIGCSDFAYRRQREAIDRLNLDPVQQDMSQFGGSSQVAGPRAIEDEVLDENRRRSNREQQVLVGTSLRDLLLRRFQLDYDPPSMGAPAGDEVEVHDALEMKPSDVDATLSPSVHADEAAPRGVISRNKLIDSWTRRYRTPEGQDPVVVEGDPVVPLNASQTRAIAMMLSERLSLVQGPPGTGKTRVIVETIKLLKQHWQLPHPILVCAHTNVAVDNLLDGLRSHGLKPVRFGTAARVPTHLQDYTFENRMEEHPAFRALERAKEEQKLLRDKMADGAMPAHVRKAHQLRVNQLNGQIFGLKKRLQFEVLADADVVCTTCLSATSRMLDNIDFPFVFLDEASMATEPLSLVPLTKGSSQVAIIGDHKQLPPVIVSEHAQAGGLATSMFERLIHERHVPSIMLDTQYRMHPDISAFSSKTFYNGQLKDGTVGGDGQVRAGLEPPETDFLQVTPEGKRLNVTFLNHDFPESPENQSIANHHEASRVCDIVYDLLDKNPDLRGEDIGVIAPYAAQIRTITEYLHVDPNRQYGFQQVLGAERAMQVADVEVKTVDGFEGREKQVIIFSTVRSNSAGYIGFLSDWRRLNVGLTRAKRGLIILGSARTLAMARTGVYATESLPKDGARVWREFMAHLRANDMVVDEDGA